MLEVKNFTNFPLIVNPVPLIFKVLHYRYVPGANCRVKPRHVFLEADGFLKYPFQF